MLHPALLPKHPHKGDFRGETHRLRNFARAPGGITSAGSRVSSVQILLLLAISKQSGARKRPFIDSVPDDDVEVALCGCCSETHRITGIKVGLCSLGRRRVCFSTPTLGRSSSVPLTHVM
jgi:hypothetical protein